MSHPNMMVAAFNSGATSWVREARLFGKRREMKSSAKPLATCRKLHMVMQYHDIDAP
jgi:hypothetical protein